MNNIGSSNFSNTEGRGGKYGLHSLKEFEGHSSDEVLDELEEQEQPPAQEESAPWQQGE